MAKQAGPSPSGSFFSSSGFAALLLVFLTLLVWIFFYVRAGEAEALTPAETIAVALFIAIILFGGRRLILSLRRSREPAPKPNKRR